MSCRAGAQVTAEMEILCPMNIPDDVDSDEQEVLPNPHEKPPIPFGDPAETLAQMERVAERVTAAVLEHAPIDLLSFVWNRLQSELSAPKRANVLPDPLGRYQFALENLHASLASSPPRAEPVVELTAERGEEILKLWEELRTITIQHCLALSLTNEDKAFGAAAGDVEFKALSTWVSIRGNRYHALEGEFFEYVLNPHDEELARQHGEGAKAIATGIQSAANAVNSGYMTAYIKYRECLSKAEAVQKEQRLNFQDALDKLIQSDQTFRKSLEEAEYLWHRAGFCNLSKNSTLPETLLADLRYECGGNTEFLAAGSYRGTPLRTLPARLRPLLLLDGETYAIDGQFLRDSTYRAIQRGLLARNPGYRQDWNTRQKNRAETAFSDILNRQLAGAFVATEVFYPDPDTGQWAETDLVVVLEDALIILEAKAGVAAMDNPATDFHRHARAIQALVLDAHRQAARFIRYLKSAVSVPIYQRGKAGFEEIRKICLKDMRQVLPIGLTLENFSPFSTICKELPGYGPIDGRFPFVSISVDDLLVLRRLLPSTGALFHYLTVRQSVAGLPGARLFDELDHLGAYIGHNRFDQTMKEQLKEADAVWWDQFSDRIDQYFGDPNWERNPIPQQKLPATMALLLQALDTHRPNGFLRCSALLRDLGGGGRENLEKTLLRLMQRGGVVPIMGMLVGDNMEPLQIWGLPSIANSRTPEFARQMQVACLASEMKAMMSVVFEVNDAGGIGGVMVGQVRSPSVIQVDYPAMLADAKAMRRRHAGPGKVQQ